MRRRFIYPLWLKGFLALTWCAILSLLAFPVATQEVRDEVGATLYDTHGQVLARYPTQDNYWRFAVQLEDIDPLFIQALLAIEDECYFTHSGVDIPAILRALKSWRETGEVVSGASTITMQLVRQYKPRDRVLASKFIESIAAIKYEFIYTKNNILEQYLTRISYGGNIQGIEAATWRYYGKKPEQLTWDEIALLIALPQAPEARRPDRHPVGAKAGRDRILDRLVRAGLLTQIIADEAKEIPVPREIYNFPSESDIGAPLLFVKGQDVKSYIDPKVQNLAHETLRMALNRDKRTVNASVVIVENKTRHVIGHVTAGKREHEGGWLDLTRSIRSPGSTLKPFIYGLAMSDGKANANSPIMDMPTRFGAYQPENFNRRYHGTVRLKDALKHSLNVPAVAALEQVGAARFEALLASAGASPRLSSHREKDSGLSLALGGAGMQAVDLATLYTGLANDGKVAPLIWTKNQKISQDTVQILPKNVAKEVTKVLASATPPQGRMPGTLAEGRPSIAYKTGTSYGARDSWAAGYTQSYTVIVWVGRPDGAPRPGETGRRSAAPLLFDIFDRMAVESNYPKASLKQREKPRTKKTDLPFKTALNSGPQISFPSDGSEVLVKAKASGLNLRAQSSRDLRFYVNGEKLEVKYGSAKFKPETSGFYTLKVVDSEGRSARSRFRVFLSDNLPNTPL